jgi:hypothetical protein
VDTTKSAIASVVGADRLIIAEVGRNRGVDATRGNIALVSSTSITIVASSGNVLPSASLGGKVASITSTEVSIVALKVVGAFSNSTATREGGSAAKSSSSSACIGEARGVGLARNRGREASSLGLIASVLLAEVSRVIAIARRRLAANTANIVGAAEGR